jgi:hypothetical protein
MFFAQFLFLGVHVYDGPVSAGRHLQQLVCGSQSIPDQGNPTRSTYMNNKQTHSTHTSR